MFKKLFLLIVIFAAISCDEELRDLKKFNAYVNEWTYSNMEGLYYWNEKLPVFKKSTATPSLYFESLLYVDDRFSAFFEDYNDLMKRLSGVTAAEIGFEYKLFLEDMNSDKVIGVVVYTKPGTHAETLNIKRGDFINRIDGTPITLNNYQSLLARLSDSAPAVKIGFASKNTGSFVDSYEYNVNKSINYSENPVLLDTVYTVGQQKIAYLVYNFFAADSGDGSVRFDRQVNEIIGRFKSREVDELILDFRYNSGGMMSSAVHLGSMLVPNVSDTKVFSYTEYNTYLTNYFNSDDYKNKYSDNPFVEYFTTTLKAQNQTLPIHNIGNDLDRIYFITGNSTASASEMVINGLKPYVDCVLVGEVTYGKNVGSVVVNDDENPDNKKAFMPIILKYFNKDRKSDFTYGFEPNILVGEDFAHELGDTREKLLATVISAINGSPAMTESAPGPLDGFKPIKNEELINPLLIFSKPGLTEGTPFVPFNR